MLRIGAGAVADMVAFDAFLFEIDEMEAPLRGMEAEIGDPDNVGPPDMIAAFDGARDFLAGDREQFAVACGSPAELRKRAGRGSHDGACGQSAGDEGTAIHAWGLAGLAWPDHERWRFAARDADEACRKCVQLPMTMRSPSIRIAPISER